MRLHAFLPVMALWAVPALAQGLPAGTTSFAFNIGWNKPMSSFDKLAENGYTGSFDFTINTSERFAFRTEFGRASNNVDASHFINVSGFDATVYSYNLTENFLYTLNPASNLNVYLIGGVGAARTTAQVGAYVYYGGGWDPWWGYYPVYGYNTAVNRTTTRLTYNGGVGLQVRFTPRFAMTLESRYTWIATQQDIEYVPIAIGFRWN